MFTRKILPPIINVCSHPTGSWFCSPYEALTQRSKWEMCVKITACQIRLCGESSLNCFVISKKIKCLFPNYFILRVFYDMDYNSARCRYTDPPPGRRP